MILMLWVYRKVDQSKYRQDTHTHTFTHTLAATQAHTLDVEMAVFL